MCESELDGTTLEIVSEIAELVVVKNELDVDAGILEVAICLLVLMTVVPGRVEVSVTTTGSVMVVTKPEALLVDVTYMVVGSTDDANVVETTTVGSGWYLVWIS